jgi:hypothetical protein
VGTKEPQNLEDREMWDFDKAERHSAVRNPRSVVSVAFSRDSFDRVAQSAEQFGMKVSEFIREAALEKANGSRGTAILTSASGSFAGPIFVNGRLVFAPVASTRVPGPTSSVQSKQGVTA